MKRGVPAVDRSWTSADYEAARKALLALAQEDTRQLPHHRSTRSAAVIQRLCDQENLGLIKKNSLPVQERLEESLKLLDAHNAICKIYLHAQVSEPKYTGDMVRMQSFALYAVAAQVSLCDPFVKTLHPEDPSYQSRLEGLARMKDGLAIMVRGVLVTLAEKQRHDVETRRILANGLGDVYPAIAPCLPPLSRKELEARVVEHAGAESDDQIRRALARALGTENAR